MNFSLSFLRLKNEFSGSSLFYLPITRLLSFKESKFSRFFGTFLRTSDKNSFVELNGVSFDHFLSSPVRHSFTDFFGKTFTSKFKNKTENFKKCTFKDIKTEENGGCIETFFNLHICECYFLKSSAKNGGAIWCNENIEFTHSFVEKCSANTTSAAIFQNYNLATNFIITSSVFKSNYASFSSVLFRKGTDDAIINSDNFTSNKVSEKYAVAELFTYKLDVSFCKLDSNKAMHENGGIYVQMSDGARIRNSIFYKCTHFSDDIHAGAVLCFVENIKSCTVSNCVFNRCLCSRTFLISANLNGRIVIMDCKFTNKKMRVIYPSYNARIFNCQYECIILKMSFVERDYSAVYKEIKGHNAVIALFFSLIPTLLYMMTHKPTIRRRILP